MPYLTIDPFWYGMRSDPRYADLLRRMGLPLVRVRLDGTSLEESFYDRTSHVAWTPQGGR